MIDVKELMRDVKILRVRMAVDELVIAQSKGNALLNARRTAAKHMADLIVENQHILSYERYPTHTALHMEAAVMSVTELESLLVTTYLAGRRGQTHR